MISSLQERFKKELYHIQNGPTDTEKPQGIGTVEFEVSCKGDSWDVLRKVKEILNIVSQAGIDSWPSDKEWPKLLPEWFVNRCAPEMSEEESQQWLKKWDTLSMEEKFEEEKSRDWSLLNWLYWMEPENRAWFWWDAIERNPNLLVVYVEVNEWPFPWGALRWLFKAAGALDIKSRE